MGKLTDDDKREAIKAIQAGEPLDERYRFLLFDSDRQTELVYNGKTQEICRDELPFQTIEQIDEPRTKGEAESRGTHDDLFSLDARGRQLKGWTNKLIWGDNRLILASLKGREWRDRIRDQGGLKLIYIDPPFNSNANYNIGGKALLGEKKVEVDKVPSLLERMAYRDTWGKGRDSFLAMLYERLQLMHGLLADDGSIYVHCDHHMNSYIRIIMDEIFGNNNFKNEIIWCYTGPGQTVNSFKHKHDTILFYCKNLDNLSFYHENIRVPYKAAFTPARGLHGKKYKDGSDIRKRHDAGKIPEDWWVDFSNVSSYRGELLGYPTQKPKALLKRIVQASSSEGDLIADFFCGSGTLAEVAEELGRKWIAADMGRFAIHTTRKRLLTTQRRLKEEQKPYRAFEILNLGKYERQHYMGANANLPLEQQEQQRRLKHEEYIRMILKAYRAVPLANSGRFHGSKNGRMVAIGSLVYPVTRDEIDALSQACFAHGCLQVDVLAFAFDHGLQAHLHARKQKTDIAVEIRLKKIPHEVFNKRLVEEGREEIKFYDLAYVEVKEHWHKKGTKGEVSKSKADEVSVEIVNFVNDYDAETREAAEEHVQHYYDWIDYWSVDFDWESKPETLREYSNDDPETYTLKRSGDYIFENEWQSFRTREDRAVDLSSARHPIPPQRKFKVAVQAIDIFGNDSMTVLNLTC